VRFHSESGLVPVRSRTTAVLPVASDASPGRAAGATDGSILPVFVQRKHGSPGVPAPPARRAARAYSRGEGGDFRDAGGPDQRDQPALGTPRCAPPHTRPRVCQHRISPRRASGPGAPANFGGLVERPHREPVWQVGSRLRLTLRVPRFSPRGCPSVAQERRTVALTCRSPPGPASRRRWRRGASASCSARERGRRR
jgi:hypothetical protein